MKDVIVLFAGILLALYIFGLIAGDENSVKSGRREIWTQETMGRQYVYMVDGK